MQMIDLYDIEYSEEYGESESRRKTMNNDELTEWHQLQQVQHLYIKSAGRN